MDTMKIVLLIMVGIGCLWLFVQLIRTKQVKTVLTTSVVSGLLALALVCVMDQFGSETLHVNPYTLGTAAVLGIPGVILMVAIKMIWVL